MASTARAPAAQTVLPDEILEEIFLRLDAAADLVRASAACSSFRRIVSERRFLRRFRSLRSPPVLGFISSTSYQGFLPVGPPHRSAREARALDQAADFAFSFVPDPSTWRFRQVRDGRVLLSRRIPLSLPRLPTKILIEDFLVCDPLHRRYVQIPRIPVDLVAASTLDGGKMMHLSPVLAPALKNNEEESFRVICSVQHDGKVVAFVFSSCNQTWAGINSMICLPKGFFVDYYMTYYAHDCIYWVIRRMGHLLMLDTREMKFSIIDFPHHSFRSSRAIVEAEDGRLGFLTIGDGTMDLYCMNWQRNGVGAQEWQHDKLIPLPPKESGINYRWKILGTAGRYLALVAYDELHPNSEHFFVLDMKTLLVEKLYISHNCTICGFPYARFPPPLALPSI